MVILIKKKMEILQQRKKTLIQENEQAISEYKKAMHAAEMFKSKALACQERLKEVEMLLLDFKEIKKEKTN